MYKISFDLPNLVKGTELDINGLGRFQNGHEYVIEDETADGFRIFHQRMVTKYNEVTVDTGEVDDDGNAVTVTASEPYYEVELGPTVLQAFQHTDGVTVETYEEPKETPAERKAREKAEADAKAKADAENKKGDGN